MTTNGKTPTEEATSDRGPDGRFKPGVSGNPNGRPTIVKQVRELLQEQVEKNIEALVAMRDNKDTKDSDRIACIKELNDRALGRAPQAVEHSGAIGSGPTPEEHAPDLASIRGRVEQQMAAERNGAVAATATGPAGETIQ